MPDSPAARMQPAPTPPSQTQPAPAPPTEAPHADDDAAVARLAKALAHPARVRIVRFLLSRPGCIGGDIVEDVGLAQSTVSEHLRILKAAGLVVGRIDHPRICYALEPAALGPLRAIVEAVAARAVTGTADLCHGPAESAPRAATMADT